jgi:hypothetical protein
MNQNFSRRDGTIREMPALRADAERAEKGKGKSRKESEFRAPDS